MVTILLCPRYFMVFLMGEKGEKLVGRGVG